MSEYNGEWIGSICGMRNNDSFEFRTSNHYPGDPNFSGSFCDWIPVIHAFIKEKCFVAIKYDLKVVIKIEKGIMVDIKKVVEV